MKYPDSRKIDLGCGNDKSEGWFGVDIVDTDDCDMVLDLDQSQWGLPENYFAEARANDVFEHLRNPVQFMENLHDILKDGGMVYISSPHFSSLNWTDPTHKRMVGYQTMFYFTDNHKFGFYSDARFEVVQSKINFKYKNPVNRLVEPLVNINSFAKSVYERTFLCRLLPANNVEFVLVKKERGV